MTRYRLSYFGRLVVLMLCVPSVRTVAEPKPSAVSAFNAYVHGVELRLAQGHGSRIGFLAGHDEASERRGDLTVERINASTGEAAPGALIHHWRGSAFAPGATVVEFERLMKNFADYPRRYSPQVLEARVLSQQDDRLQAFMRVRQRHVLTLVMDTTYDITYGRLDGQHGYSVSQSTRISEIDSAGTSAERVVSSSDEHGFLWRQNTYWSYEERDGGLYMQIESVSLTRSIPRGLGWAVRPFVESVPRESLEFTLRSTCNALRK
jgi:hypothetical protein